MDEKEAPAADRPQGEEAAKGLEVYDFRNPNRLSREHLRKIEYLHSSFAKRLSINLAGLVRDSVGVEIGEVKEITHAELLESVPVPGAAFTFGVEPAGGLGVIDIDPLLAFSLVDRLFGGTGEPLAEPRDLTAIEQNVIRKVAARILKEAETAWNTLAEVRLEPPRFVPNMEFVKSPSFNESMVRVRLEIQKGSLDTGVSIVYPYVMLEPLIKAGSEKDGETSQGGPNAQTVSRVRKIVPLELTVSMPVSMIRFGELMNLDKGDVLVLDNRVSDEVYVSVGKRMLLAGRPGKHRGSLAVKVTTVFRKGGLENVSR
jgi:flagellar motor switch protein FliM